MVSNVWHHTRLRLFLLGLIASLLYGGAGWCDDVQYSLEHIPKLPIFSSLIDYREALAAGTMAPDRVAIDSVQVRTGMTELKLVGSLGSTHVEYEKPEFRSKEEQWSYLNGLLQRNNNSMHYYILAELYYHRQMTGWFKVYMWHIEGVGELRIFFVSNREIGPFRVYLLHLKVEPVSVEQVNYKKGAEGLSLVRKGKRLVEWDVDRNTVIIGGAGKRRE